MPNILLFGGSQALFDMLSRDPQWKVQRAMHGSHASLGVLGDPRRWHLVIDDCPNWDSCPAEGMAMVSKEYLAEMERARGIAIGAGLVGSAVQVQHHLNVCRAYPRGACDLEFNQTNAAEARHLVDFIDAFESAFLRQHLDFWTPEPALNVLLRDHYGDALVVVRQHYIPWLHTIGIADSSTRLKAYEHLCYRTVPKLWPEVYSDLFRPRKVQALEGERERIITQRRQQVAEIDATIDEELRFYAVYAPLTELGDDPLKLLVKRAFEEVFGCSVMDLDEEVGEGEPKTLDLLVQRSGWTALVEVRASRSRGARKDDVEKLEEHCDALAAKYGKPGAKVFIFNGMYRREPEKRTESTVFNGTVVGEAQPSGVTLVSTIRLLQVIEARRNGEITDEEFIKALSVPGLFRPPGELMD